MGRGYVVLYEKEEVEFKVMKPLMTLLRSWGVRIIIYIDDMLILAETRGEVSQHLEVLLFLLEALGFIVN